MPQKYGKYLLTHRIAIGGMAEIFLARHQGMEGFEKTLVIKRIRSHLSEQPTFVNMFLNEAKLAAQLNHSNIAQIFDLGKIGNCYFIAMEYVRGRDMRAVVAKANACKIPFPLEYSLKVVAEVCEALFYAHRMSDEDGSALQIVHRDINPENIMVSFDGEVKILDFGIAKAENLTRETKAGELKGKFAYMSPEQVMGKAVDQRSDLFSLGVVMYEWVTHHRLFGDSSEVDTLRNVVEAKIYPPSYFNPDVPAEVERIILKALQRNREERYPSASDFQYDINQFLSTQEFLPTTIHLSNFLHQLYGEEIHGLPGKPLENALEGMEGENRFFAEEPGAGPSGEECAQRIDSHPGERVAVSIEVHPGLFQAISELASRNGLTVSQLIEAILTDFTRFR